MPPPLMPPPPPNPTLRSRSNNLDPDWLHGLPDDPTRQRWANRYNYMARVLDRYGRRSNFYDNEGNLRWSDIRAMNLNAFKRLVNDGWRKVVRPVRNDELKGAQYMVDPGQTTENSIVSSTRVYKAFNLYKIGFRGDSRAPRTGAAPVFNHGFVARYALPGIENGHQPHYVLETIVSTGMCINLPNQDFFNETGVCVSRSVHGATKFPAPDEAGPHWLYAVRVDSGFDTEAWQLRQLGNNPHALWRPGEKAVSQAASRHVLAAVQFRRRNYNAVAGVNDVWYEYRLEGNIVWNTATGGAKVYIRNELEPLLNTWTRFWRREDFKL